MALHIDKDVFEMAPADARLFRAVSEGNHARVRRLLNPGFVSRMFFGEADVDCESSHDGRTCIMEAILNKDVEMVGILLEAGADLDKCDHFGRTVLHMAVYRREPRNLAVMLQRVPHLLEKEHLFQKTPLWLAAHLQNEDAVELLIKAGADYNRCDGEFNVRPINLWPEMRNVVVRLAKQNGSPGQQPAAAPSR